MTQQTQPLVKQNHQGWKYDKHTCILFVEIYKSINLSRAGQRNTAAWQRRDRRAWLHTWGSLLRDYPGIRAAFLRLMAVPGRKG